MSICTNILQIVRSSRHINMKIMYSEVGQAGNISKITHVLNKNYFPREKIKLCSEHCMLLHLIHKLPQL